MKNELGSPGPEAAPSSGEQPSEPRGLHIPSTPAPITGPAAPGTASSLSDEELSGVAGGRSIKRPSHLS